MESTSADSSSNQKREADEECNVNASSSQAVGATPTQGKKNARNWKQIERSDIDKRSRNFQGASTGKLFDFFQVPIVADFK